MNFGSSLANENVACEYELTVSTLYAKTFSFAITTVLSRTHSLFMGE
jgi:hypothetical protein